MLRRFALAVSLTLPLSLGSPYAAQASHSVIAAAAYVTMFDSESAAQAHCPSDIVVWLNTKTGVWHEKGMRWYGRTREGSYVCRKEAAAAGYRDTGNGQ